MEVFDWIYNLVKYLFCAYIAIGMLTLPGFILDGIGNHFFPKIPRGRITTGVTAGLSGGLLIFCWQNLPHMNYEAEAHPYAVLAVLAITFGLSAFIFYGTFACPEVFPEP